MRSYVSWSFLVAAVAALILTVMPASATGNTQREFTPQMTNVPYLAWNGEIVRLVKCYDSDIFSMANVTPSTFFDRFKAEVNVESWTGSPAPGPIVVQNSVAAFSSMFGTCVRADVISIAPGLAQMELDVTDWDGEISLPPHVFLTAWMNLSAPTIAEMSNADLTAVSAKQDTGAYGVVANLKPDAMHQKAGVLLGDPTVGTFAPLADASAVNYLLDGLIRVNVTGQFPKAGGGMWTMPTDWAALADMYESDSVSPTGHDSSFWDIHDPLSADPTQLTTDTIASLATGPFDPLRAEDTYLPDGQLNAGDAPMPAARVDLHIAAGGVGGFDSVMKEWVYTKDASLPIDSLGNAYAPFYSQYIPATTAGEWASGIDGPAQGNNFKGFLVDGKYGNWMFPYKTALVTNADRLVNPNVCKTDLGWVRMSPKNVPDTVSVYTDEHGEAIVAYNPDKGFYFKADSNKRCDLGTGAAGPVQLGSSTISAVALYPYKPVDPVAGIPSATTLTKTVFGLPSNILTCIPKSTNEEFCVQTIKDIYGNPVRGAKVQFTVEPAGPKLVAESIVLGGFDTTGQHVWSTDPMTLITGSNGQVGVDVISTLPGRVDLLSEDLLTRAGGAGILRDALITFGQPAPPVVVYPPVTSIPAPATASVVTLPGSAKPVSPAAKPKVVKKASVVTARLVTMKAGKALMVKVSSANKTAKVRVTLLKKAGKTVKVVTRTVKTNKLVRVPNLTIAKTIVAVRVAVIR